MLKPKKSFIVYPFVTLLRRKVDGFGLTITKEKVKAITELTFPGTL